SAVAGPIPVSHQNSVPAVSVPSAVGRGRPAVAAAIREPIQTMGRANVLWGTLRIHGELLKLGINVAPSTVGKCLRRNHRPPSQTWRPFLNNHMKQMASMDFFTVPTAWFRVLFVFVVLSHARRRVVHFNVTEHPTEEWTAQQIREAFPWDEAPRYLIRDRDHAFDALGVTAKAMERVGHIRRYRRLGGLLNYYARAA